MKNEDFFTQKELDIINEAIKNDNPWYLSGVKNIKAKIKEYYRGVRNSCCYCRRSLHGEFSMVVDVEHVLPSSKYRAETFEMWNLNIACKRCNMNIKGANVDFVVASISNKKTSDYYRLIHPNFDIYEKSISILFFSITINQLSSMS